MIKFLSQMFVDINFKLHKIYIKIFFLLIILRMGSKII